VFDWIRRIAKDDAVEGIVGRAHLYRASPIGLFKKDEDWYESENQIVILTMPPKPTGGIAADGNDLQFFCTHNIHEPHHKLPSRTLTAQLRWRKNVIDKQGFRIFADIGVHYQVVERHFIALFGHIICDVIVDSHGVPTPVEH
jgi:hypothetical protein